MQEIRRYDAEDAATCAARVRDEAGLEKALDRIEAIYRQALEAPPFGDASPAAESRSASRYLLFLAPTLKNAWGVVEQREEAEKRAEELGSEVSRMRATITWRLRDLLLTSRMVRAGHRVLRRLP